MAVWDEVDERLPPALVDAFLLRARPLSARKNEIVIAERSESRDVFLIRTGRMQVLLSSAHGREVILREMTQGHIFGEMAAIEAQPRSARVVAVSDCKLSVMSGDEFLAFLAQIPEAGLWMTQQLSKRVRDLTEKTFALALLPIATRIQAELLRIAQRSANFSEGADTVEVKDFPTHAELAARVGTHREGVSRELSLLAKEGVIAQQGRTLTILSLHRLRAEYERIGR